MLLELNHPISERDNLHCSKEGRYYCVRKKYTIVDKKRFDI